ncbi:MAG: type II secretion system F family protein [Acidimicrobiales bacterium]
MPDTYTYKVRDTTGKIVQGVLEADSQGLVVNKLRQMGYVPLAVDKKGSAGLKTEIKIPGLSDRVKQKEIAVFCRQFATMVNSGLTLLRSLSILTEQTENATLAKVLNQVRQEVEAGSSLSMALGRHPKVFNRLFVAMVRSGETSGGLDQVLLELAATIEKSVELRRKVISAMTYPVAVLCLVLVILTAMLVFVVPQFKTIFASLGGKLPTPTLILIDVSNTVVSFAPVVVVVLVAGVFGFRWWINTPAGRALWDRFKLRVPLLGNLVRKTSLARFSRTLASLLSAGVPILESLEITKASVGNTVVANAISDMQEGVRGGEALARRLPNHPVYPPMVYQMLAVGEETGAVDTMLNKVAEFFEQEVEAIVAALTSLLEPLLIVVLGSTVGAMVISLYLPMFNVIKLIK